MFAFPVSSFPECSRSSWLFLALLTIAWTSSQLLIADEDGLAFFESRIRPALVKHCFECHSTSATEISGGLLLDSREGIAKGGDSGPAIDLKDVSKSLLIQALRHKDLKMPPKSKLPDTVIADFEKWIAMGAPDPRNDPVTKPKNETIDWIQAKQFWSFRQRDPIGTPTVHSNWSRTPIDSFIDEKRSRAGLEPNPESSRTTWLRRVFLDLNGLPPSPDEVDAFVQSEQADAYEQVVDQLLASPRYGERWGRYWLDLARYADSNGADENHGYPVAWRYRDYVIDALNADLPYNEFIIEQLAGDLLPADSEAEQRRLITATGFLVIGPKMLAEQDKPKLVADMVDEQLDTIGKVFLGLTLGCARCHDHKFDPILAKDYYALAGILQSTKSMEHLNFVSQWNERDLPDEVLSKTIQIHQEKIDKFNSEINEKKRLYSDRAFETQLDSLLAAMSHSLQTDVSQAKPITKESEKWQQLLKNAPDASSKENDFLSLWRRLVSLEKDVFAEKAMTIWQELAADEKKRSAWDIRLSKRPHPASVQELLDTYASVLREIWAEVRDAPRNDKGKITSSETAKLFKQFFGGELFVYTEKIEETLEADEKKSYLELQATTEKLLKEKPSLPRAMAVTEGPTRFVAVNVRGNHLQTTGEPLVPSIPTVFRGETNGWELTGPEKGSGRLELAKWIADKNHPLTARVMVNRIWQGHFAEGLVTTASNFGRRGQLPTHPELLDWLANKFVKNDWSVKRLHRQIVLSSAYRMASHSDPDSELIDPDNGMLWRQNRRRMEIEVLRDALLAIGAVLDSSLGGAPRNATTAMIKNFSGTENVGCVRRTVYLDINRAAMSDFLMTFDYVEPGVSVERRPATIVPHQSLFMMNNPLPLEIGKQLATRVHLEQSNDLARLATATRTVFGRTPKTKEIEAIREFLLSVSVDPDQAALKPSLASMNSSLDDWVRVCRSLLLANEFLYVD